MHIDMTTNSTDPVSTSSLSASPADLNSTLLSSSSLHSAEKNQFSELLAGIMEVSALTSSDSSGSSMSSLMAPMLLALMQTLLSSEDGSSSTGSENILSSLLGSTKSSSLLGSGTSPLFSGMSTLSPSLLNAASGMNAYQASASAQPSRVLSSYDTTQYPITATGAYSQAAPPTDYVPMYTSIGYGSVPNGLPVNGVLTQNYHPGHIGVDTGVQVGTPENTTMDGKVIYAGWNNEGYGNLVIVENGKYKTYYAHLSSIPVSQGDVVKKGQTIGLSGTTGNSTGPHVHYEVRVNNQAVNPANYNGQPY
jgi:murein DD-endopeptidase MepM/ murein hydrolase activator NlpD